MGLILCFSGLVLASVAPIFLSLFQGFNSNWFHVQNHLLGEVLYNTFLLVFLTVFATLIFGTACAWLVVRYSFHGSFYWERLLVLPLTIPPYIYAIALLDVFDSSGVINGVLSAYGLHLRVNFSNPFVVATTISLVFYPYVYLVLRSAFSGLSNNSLAYGKVLGLSEIKLFWRVVLPLVRPALLGAAGLVFMETMADFGTVSIFNYDTLTTLVYKSWFSLFDITTALQISSLFLLIVLVCYFAVTSIRNSKGNNNSQHDCLEKKALTGWPSVLACLLCFGMFFVAFVLPVSILLVMSLSISSSINIPWEEILSIVTNTGFLALTAAFITACMGFFLVIMERQVLSAKLPFVRTFKLFCKMSTLGYAIPGSILAMGVFSVMLFLQDQFSIGYVSQSVFALLLVYTVRFVAVAKATIGGAAVHLSEHLPQAAATLGSSRVQVMFRVYWPNLKVPIISASVLVFIEVVKELPATLMMRPFGWDTLAVTIFSYASEGEWGLAAMLALIVIAVAQFFIFVLLPSRRRTDVL